MFTVSQLSAGQGIPNRIQSSDLPMTSGTLTTELQGHCKKRLLESQVGKWYFTGAQSSNKLRKTCMQYTCTTKFAYLVTCTKYMSVLHIWHLSWLTFVAINFQIDRETSDATAIISKQHPKTTRQGTHSYKIHWIYPQICLCKSHEIWLFSATYKKPCYITFCFVFTGSWLAHRYYGGIMP